MCFRSKTFCVLLITLIIAKPLRQIEAKDVQCQWDEIQQRTCKEIKKLITSHPLLHYYYVSSKLIFQCDALQSRVRAALLQVRQTVAFKSPALIYTERNNALTERKLLAILQACDRFDQYVFGRDINSETHNKPLVKDSGKSLLEETKRLRRMTMQLQKYNLEVLHKRRVEMYIASTLT